MTIRPGARSDAAIRARTSRDTLAYLDVYRPGAKAAVEAALPTEVRDAIEAPGSTGYVPLWADASMGEVIVEHLGPEDARAFWIRYITHHLDSPLLASTVKTAVSLFGATPGGLLRWLPRALSLVFRDTFEARVELRGENAAEVRFESGSPEFLAGRAYPIVLEAMVRAIYVATSATGDVRVARRDAERAYVVTATFRT